MQPHTIAPGMSFNAMRARHSLSTRSPSVSAISHRVRRPARIARRLKLQTCATLPDGIMLQGFHWESSTPDVRDPSQWPNGKVGSSWYQTVKLKVEEIREIGFTDIWLPPPSQSVAREGYLPTKLYDLDSAYGSYKELRSLLRTMQAQGVGAVLDTVINHRCGDTQNEKGKWVMFSDEMGHDNKRLDWGPWALTSNHPDPDLAGTGAVKLGGGTTMNTHYGAAPNVDHSNTEVREALISWLNYMTRPRDLGFSSIRFDFVRGYEEYIKEYVDSTVYPRGELSVAEWWNDDDGRNPAYTNTEMLVEFVDKHDGHTGAWDFSLKTAIHKAALDEDWSLLGSKERGLPGLVGQRPALAFTYIDNHDTSPPQAHYPFPDSVPKLLAAHAFILTHPGIPCVFWLHLFGKRNADGLLNGKEPDVTIGESDGQIDKRGVWVPPNNPGFEWAKTWPDKEPWTVGSQDGVQGPIYTGIAGDEIKKMVRARSDAGIRSDSKVEVLESRKDLYKAVVTGRTRYGSSREGASQADVVYQLMVCIGPDAKHVPKGEGWECMSAGTLHAVYLVETEVEHLEEDSIMDRPHTFYNLSK
mmetsp:Transcript_2625/g.4408  ORF Transcript_2625/g.4408 Transcript_2625/m.4408 type:complete len:583 (-) Transcript_2625:304-2052(-)